MMTRTQRRNLRNGLLFIAPWLAGFLVFSLYPLGASIYYSFCRYNVVTPPHWIGLGNYREIFLEDANFLKSLWNTFYMMVIGLPLGLAVAFLLAILLNLKVRGQAFFRTIFYLPSILPVVASAILWLWIFNPEFGLANALLGWFHLPGPGWLTDARWCKPALILMNVWGVGNTMIIFLAGLQQVPQSLYEAALVDGASRWQRLRHITLPCLSPVIFFNLIMGVIGSFQYFTQVYVMTASSDNATYAAGGPGGPQGSALVYALYLYGNAFQNFKMGYASALAWILFFVTLAFVLLVFKSSGWVHYSED